MSTVVGTFLKNVLRSRLLTREQLQNALRTLPRDLREQPEGMADHLVKHGRLTPYQAQKLLLGVAGGLVLGPYEVQAPLGRGGMGTVFLALDTRDRLHVALKVLPPKRA